MAEGQQRGPRYSLSLSVNEPRDRQMLAKATLRRGKNFIAEEIVTFEVNNELQPGEYKTDFEGIAEYMVKIPADTKKIKVKAMALKVEGNPSDTKIVSLESSEKETGANKEPETRCVKVIASLFPDTSGFFTVGFQELSKRSRFQLVPLYQIPGLTVIHVNAKGGAKEIDSTTTLTASARLRIGFQPTPERHQATFRLTAKGFPDQRLVLFREVPAASSIGQ